MARVCVFIRSLTLGGAEKQATLLAHALQGEHEVQVLVMGPEDQSPRHIEFLAHHGLRTTFLPRGALRKLLALRRHLARERIQALFCFLPSDSVVGALVGRLAGVERIYCGIRNARMKRRKELALRLVHNHVADGTISNSRAAAEHFGCRGFAREKLRVVPNGIFLDPPPRARAGAGPVVLLTAARFVAEKDHAMALAALRRVLDAGVASSEVRYLLAGSGPLEASLRSRIRELGLEECVSLVLEPGEIRPLFERADVYISTSHHEGLSNSIMEAMNAGLPVVATDVGDNALLVHEGRNGSLVSIGDEEALAGALLSLIRSSELRRRQGAESHRILAQGHSFETFRDAYLELLEQDFPRPGPARSGAGR